MPSTLKHKLTQLGLGKNESAVYLELLQLELTTVGPIVSQTKLHRQLVYEALEDLIDRGLATRVLKNRRQHYQACSPEQFRTLLEERSRLTESLVPELLKLQAVGDDRLEVKTLYGTAALYDNLRTLIESAERTDKLIRIIGGAPAANFYESIGNRYVEYIALLEKYKIRKQLLAPENVSSQFKERFAKEKRTVLRTMKVGLSAPTYTRITKEMTSIEIYSSEMVVVQIRNRAIASGYLEHFKLLWDNASTVP